MNIKITSYKLVCMAIYMQALYAYLPLIRVLPDSIRMIWRAIPFILISIAVVLKKDTLLWKTYVLVNLFALFMATIRGLVYSNGTVESVMMNCANSVLYWICLLEGYFVLRFFEAKTSIKMLKNILPIVAFTSITSSVYTMIFPGVIRESTAFHVEDFGYYKYNVGAYSYVYSIVFLFTVLFFFIKENKNFPLFKKSYLFFVLGIIALNILLSQFMTAIAVTAVSFLVFVSKRRSKDVFKTIALCIVIFAVMYVPLTKGLYELAIVTKDLGMSSLYERLMGIYTVLTTGITFSGDVGARIHLYLTSLIHVKDNVLFGLMGKLNFRRAVYYSVSQLLNHLPGDLLAVGQHSDLIDLLGGCGVLGTVPFVYMFSFFWKKIKKMANNNLCHKYLCICGIQYIIYGLFDHSFSCADVAFTIFVVNVLMTKLSAKQPVNSQ